MASRSRGTKSAGSKLRAPSRARIVSKAKASTRKASSRKASSREVEKGPSTAPMRLPRIAKGKKPQYFSDPATDKLLWMTLTLMEELSVTRDRLDTVERLLAKRRLLTRKDIESWKPDDDASAERAARRAAYVDRMMRAVHRELEELTRGDMPTSEAEVIAAVEA